MAIRILYLTNKSKETIMALPSNVSYYVKRFYENPSLDIKLLNPNRSKNIWSLAIAIWKISPQILYIDNLQGLNLLIVLKQLRLLNCKIVVWKYTQCVYYDSSIIGRIKNYILKRIYWKGFNRIYMAYDKHTEHAINNKIIAPQQISTLSRGVDEKWYQQFNTDLSIKPKFTVIATGKDNRDYYTLCKACEETLTPCLILTRRHPANIKVATQFTKSAWIKIIFIEDLNLKDEYKYIMKEVSKASILAIPCEKVPYGVGYTNEIEALPFYIPILVTHNEYAHLHVEKEGIGYEIPLHDTTVWKEKIQYLKQHPEVISTMSNNIKCLIKREYNDNVTAQFIESDFIQLCTTK